MREPRKCSVEGCGRVHFVHGYCNAHRQRYARLGTPLADKPLRTAPGVAAAWLLSHANYEGDGCLFWPFGKLPAGYGTVDFGEGTVLAHRRMCELRHGKPPSADLDAAHSCGRESCVNPNHLRWATSTENQADKLIHDTHLRGERNHQHKLTCDEVRQIRSVYAAGNIKMDDLAEIHAVGKSTIFKVVHRESWGWLT